jgi:hypothetical protein
MYSAELLSVVGEQTGPVTGKPPPVSNETKAALVEAAKTSAVGQHVPGRDAGSKIGTVEAVDGEKKVKSEKECTYSLSRPWRALEYCISRRPS